MVIIFTVLVLVGYPLVFETATRGRSLGKMAMGLRVVSDDGGPERFRQALFRALAGVIEIWMFFGAPAVICSLISPKGKRIGDVFAGTVVISERGPKTGATADDAAGAGVVGVIAATVRAEPDQAELARQFLSRAPQLEPQLRDQMALRIAGEVLARDLPTAAAGHTAAVRAGRRAGRAAPPGTTAARRRSVPAGAGDATVGPVPAAVLTALTAERVRATRLEIGELLPRADEQ